MPDNEYRRIPWKRCVHISVEMYYIRLKIVSQFEQPFTGFLQILPRILHPLELELTFEYPEVRHLSGFLPLGWRKWGSHRRDNYLDIALS